MAQSSLPESLSIAETPIEPNAAQYHASSGTLSVMRKKVCCASTAWSFVSAMSRLPFPAPARATIPIRGRNALALSGSPGFAHHRSGLGHRSFVGPVPILGQFSLDDPGHDLVDALDGSGIVGQMPFGQLGHLGVAQGQRGRMQ